MISASDVQAIQLSLLVGVTAVIASLPWGILLGWLLARKHFYGKMLLETLINLPLVLPPVVTGYLLLLLLGRRGWLGGLMDEWLGIRFVFDWKGAAVASAVVAFPLMVRAMRVAFASVDARLEMAARTLGASKIRSFATITLPLARHGIIAGCVLAFARSIGEFGATIMLAGNVPGETRTIPLYVYTLLEMPGGIDASVPVVVVSVLIAAAALLVGELLDRRSRRNLLV